MKRSLIVTLAMLTAVPGAVDAHAPSVDDLDHGSPATALVLGDPTLSRAIGATIDQPGEVDWYRMELLVGDPLVVGMTAPDAAGSVPATFLLLGPGLPDAASAGARAATLALEAGATGAIAYQPAAAVRETHAGLGFIDYGLLDLAAPASGTFWIVVSAVDPAATGKYVLAPGVREEFGADAIAGMVDLIDFFAMPWPASSPPPSSEPVLPTTTP